MKRLFLMVISTSFFVALFGQTNKEDIDMVQTIYGVEKKSLVAEFIMPPDSLKKQEFWKLYNAYEVERKAYGQQRIALLDKYADSYVNLDDKTTESVIRETTELQKNVDGLIVKYYDKMKKSVGVKQAAQFYQLENYLLSITRIYILSNIPFIGEMEKLPIPPKQ